MDNIKQFTHIDDTGKIRMVDVSSKPVSLRVAEAEGYIIFSEDTADKIKEMSIPKGNVLSCALTAGVMAAKNTAFVIPLCHQIALTDIDINYEISVDRIRSVCTVKSTDKTGCEMEALHGVTVSLLTIYDMCKGYDKKMIIEGVRLCRKSKVSQ